MLWWELNPIEFGLAAEFMLSVMDSGPVEGLKGVSPVSSICMRVCETSQVHGLDN